MIELTEQQRHELSDIEWWKFDHCGRGVPLGYSVINPLEPNRYNH